MYYDENNKEEIRELLVGRKVIKVDDETLTLDDGKTLVLAGNDGGCSCGAGDYYLRELNGCDNIITSVEFEDNPADDTTDFYEGYYKIFVLADNNRINLATFEGSDGNGYYGTGYTIQVKE